MARYRVEPYVVAADIYSVSPHAGRGGWTWYTGSAGWLYRLVTETLLGLQIEVDKLHFAPLLPANWRCFALHYRYRETLYHIQLFNDGGKWLDKQRVILDDAELSDDFIPLKDDHAEHKAEVRFGELGK